MSPKQKFLPTLTAYFGDLDFVIIGQIVFVVRENRFLIMVCIRGQKISLLSVARGGRAHTRTLWTVRWQRIATRTEPAWKFSNVHMSLAPSRPCVRCQVVWISSIEVL